MGTSERYAAKGDEERYKSVFGDIDEEEVEKLNEHLENRQLQIQQEKVTKDQALGRLEKELRKKFSNRI